MGIVDSILEVQREEKRKKHITLYVLVIAIVAFSLWVNIPQPRNIDFGNATSVSYQIPNYYSPDVLISGLQTFPAYCLTYENKTMICVEPLLQTFFIQNLTSGISRYEQAVHMRLKNTGAAAFNVSPYFGAALTNCTFSGEPFDLAAGATSGRISFKCAGEGSLRKINGVWRATYFESGKFSQSLGVFRTS